jgi:hypothetical protein
MSKKASRIFYVALWECFEIQKPMNLKLNGLSMNKTHLKYSA